MTKLNRIYYLVGYQTFKIKMVKTFRAYLPPSAYRKYSCVHCRAHLASHDDLISKVCGWFEFFFCFVSTDDFLCLKYLLFQIIFCFPQIFVWRRFYALFVKVLCGINIFFSLPCVHHHMIELHCMLIQHLFFF